jgi:hypothetical protein
MPGNQPENARNELIGNNLSYVPVPQVSVREVIEETLLNLDMLQSELLSIKNRLLEHLESAA